MLGIFLHNEMKIHIRRDYIKFGKGRDETMNFNLLKKKASALIACGAMAIPGVAAMAPNIAYAETEIETDSISGTILITGFDSNLKSFQLYNYNASSVTYNGRVYKTGALMAIIPVNDDGTASISGLPYGVYRVKEYKTKKGYSTNKTYYTIKIVDNGEEDLVPDEPELGTTGDIRLIGANGISLAGMEFQLRNVGASSIVYEGTVINVGEVVGVFTSSSDECLIADLPYGVYELEQVSATTGYHTDESIYTINIINSGTVDITIQVSDDEHIHVWDGGTVTTEPTCTEPGVITYTCTVCGGTKTETVAKLGHTWYTENPTCMEEGYRECLRCGEKMMIPATDHAWDDGILMGNESCEGNPYRLYTCTYCGQEKIVALPRVLGHAYESSVTKATPDSDGGIIKVCKKCGHVETDSVLARIDRVELEYDEIAYTGQAMKPSVTVYDTNGRVIPKNYYSVNYYNNIKVGTASVKVSFKGNYSGQITEQFAVLPRGTSILSLTPLYHGFTVKWAMQSKEVTGYELEYASEEDFSDAGILQTTKYTTLAKTVAGLRPNTKYYVRIRTYKGSSYSAWSAVKTVVTKK